MKLEVRVVTNAIPNAILYVLRTGRDQVSPRLRSCEPPPDSSSLSSVIRVWPSLLLDSVGYECKDGYPPVSSSVS